MAQFNSLTILGNIGTDPELKVTSSNTPVLNFRLAVNSQEKGVEQTMWLTITVWGKAAESSHRVLRKGQRVLVTGALKVREWEKDGRKGTSVEVNCGYSLPQILDRKEPGAAGGNGAEEAAVEPTADVPF